MTESVFINRNEEQWAALEAFNRRLTRGGVKKLSLAEVREFARLSRLAGYHLAYAKTHYPEGESVVRLNRIAGVSHNYFYTRETSGLAEIKRFIVSDFPKAVHEWRKYFYASTLVFIIGALFAALYVAGSAERFAQIIPEVFSGGASGPGDWDYPLMSATIMTNNIRVSFSAFALGMFAGLGTVYILFYNGMIIGALTAYIAMPGGDMAAFLSLILPHGVLELFAIFLSGACGLMIGRALLIPGDYSRKHSLIKAVKSTAVLIPGIVIMLIIAGLIEGFFTPLALPAALKLVFAGLTLCGLLVYLIPFGKRDTY